MILQAKGIVFTAGVSCALVLFSQSPVQSQHLTSIEKKSEKTSADTTVHTPVDSTLLVREIKIKQIITKLPEHLVVDQFKCLETTIPMTYNTTTKGFINSFTARNRTFVKTMLERKHLYFPLYEEALKKHGLPDELKYLSIVESNLNPRAVSPVKAAGLWQFMPATGRYFKLYQDAYIDERLDPYKATEAACQYLKSLHDMFGDWQLALAAYNCGPGNVRRAIRRSGNKKGFWQIYNHLPVETRAYVPKFIAVNYIMTHAEHYNITTDSLPRYISADTIIVNHYLDMNRLAKQLGVSLEDLRTLNPQVKKNVIPGYLKNYSLRIPAEKKEFFASNRMSILESSSMIRNTNSTAMLVSNSDAFSNTSNRKKILYEITYGDAISTIAAKYNVSVTDIKQWNNLRSNTIIAGQKIAIWIKTPAKATVAENNTQPAPNMNLTVNAKVVFASATKVYLVQPGDSLWTISQNHGGMPVDKI